MWVWSLGWEDPLEKGMATHSSILSWEVPWTEKPGGIQSVGSQSNTQLKWLSTSVRLSGSTHSFWTSLVAQTVKNLGTWVRSLGREATLKEAVGTTPVFFPREFQRQRSLASYSPWSCKESDMTEQLPPPRARSLITKTCWRASVEARLRSQNGLGQNGSLTSRKPYVILFLQGL